MACNSCETTFQGSRSIIVTVTMAGGTANVSVKNQGRNIVMIRRILLCYTQGSLGAGMLYLRPPGDPISWIYPTAFLEPGTTASYYNLTASNLTLVQAQAEYIEIEGRSLSCSATS